MNRIRTPEICLIIVCFIGVVLIGGCMRAPVVPPVGHVYNNFTAPLDIDLDKTDMGTKKGESSCFNILGLVSVGDASVKAAAAKGNISKVMHADYKYFNILGVYQKYTTVVYGE